MALIIATLLAWASVPLFITQLRLWHMDAFSTNAWRYGISAAFWLPYLIYIRGKGGLPRQLLVAAIVPTLFNIAGQTFFAWGPYLLDPGYFTFVFRVQIVFVTIGAWLLFPAERGTLRSKRYWIGVVGVIGGSVGLVLLSDGTGHGATVIGVVVAVSGGALFAGYGLSVRYFVSSYSSVTGFGVICQFTAVGVIGSTLIVQAIQPAVFGTIDVSTPLGFEFHQWAVLVASAFVGIAISHVLYYAALTRLGVAVSIGIVQLQPVITAGVSTMLGWEHMNGWQWGSGVLGVCGALVMLTAGRRPVTPDDEARVPLDVGEESEIAVHR